MQPPKDVHAVIRLAVDAAVAEAEEFLDRPGRRRTIEEAVFGPWQNGGHASAENRKMALLGAREGLRQYLYEEALVAMVQGGAAGRLQ
jgi:hypothetical protein